MKTPAPRLTPNSELEAGFAKIRTELGVPDSFPASVEQAATHAARDGVDGFPRAGGELTDKTSMPYITIDPPTSIDLDQAVHIESRSDGYTVSYAIADPGSFVAPNDPVDVESHRRGLTFYAPDMRTPLYPTSLGEGAASLLPDVERPAFVWTMTLDVDGVLLTTHVERAMVKSIDKLSYRVAQDRIDAGEGDSTLMALREVGELRLAIESQRGGVSLNLPSQEVQMIDGCYELVHDESLIVEDWNAQISLLTGMAAADLMIGAGVGLLRTLPDPDQQTLDKIRLSALSLGIDWPSGRSYSERVRELRPDKPRHVALLNSAVRALRGAGYLAFDGEVPSNNRHWAIAAEYAHVTAPVRRLADRYANEIAVAICANERPPAWVMDQLADLPSTMGKARRAEGQLERAIVDYVEAAILSSKIGQRFPATVTSRRRDGLCSMQINEPAISALVKTEANPGEVIEVELVTANPEQRKIRFREVRE